ncbi:MAG: hypothetical protein NZ518_06425, partial [Dehalococcoidia bacterium]|nr:hypothetical protein [Dehalococcoidia bacterium]
KRATDVPPSATRVDRALGPDVTLAGVAIGACPSTPCHLPVTLYWRTARSLNRDWTVFVHIVAEDGAIVAQADGPPDRGARPTRDWLPGEVVADPRDVALPAGASATAYRVVVGLYDPRTGERLGGAGFDAITVGTVTIGRR